jgi:hypothetical protein
VSWRCWGVGCACAASGQVRYGGVGTSVRRGEREESAGKQRDEASMREQEPHSSRIVETSKVQKGGRKQIAREYEEEPSRKRATESCGRRVRENGQVATLAGIDQRKFQLDSEWPLNPGSSSSVLRLASAQPSRRSRSARSIAEGEI